MGLLVLLYALATLQPISCCDPWIAGNTNRNQKTTNPAQPTATAPTVTVGSCHAFSVA
jgi:hypothetical protein